MIGSPPLLLIPRVFPCKYIHSTCSTYWLQFLSHHYCQFWDILCHGIHLTEQSPSPLTVNFTWTDLALIVFLFFFSNAGPLTTAPHMSEWMTKLDRRLSWVTCMSVQRTSERWVGTTLPQVGSAERNLLCGGVVSNSLYNFHLSTAFPE